MNWVILFDCSKILKRRDLKLKDIRIFIKKITKLQPNSFFSLVTFSNKTDIVFPLQKDVDSLFRKINEKEFFKKYSSRGNPDEIKNSINTSIKIITDYIGKISSKSNRIFILTSNEHFIFSEKYQTIVRKVKSFGIYIDVILLTKKKIDLKINDFFKLTKPTGGLFQHFKNKNKFLSKIKKIVNNIMLGNEDSNKFDLITPKDKIRKENDLSGVAKYLVHPTKEENIKIRKKNSTIMCQICLKNKSPVIEKSPLRFCPHCKTPMHLHCAGIWSSKSSKSKNKHIFRCPYCYTLLKIRKEIVKGLKRKRKIKQKGNVNEKLVKMIRVEKKDLNLFNNECIYCFKKFENNSHNIFKCSYCSSLFHEICIQKMYDKGKKCQNCGSKIT